MALGPSLLSFRIHAVLPGSCREVAISGMRSGGPPAGHSGTDHTVPGIYTSSPPQATELIARWAVIPTFILVCSPAERNH